MSGPGLPAIANDGGGGTWWPNLHDPTTGRPGAILAFPGNRQTIGAQYTAGSNTGRDARNLPRVQSSGAYSGIPNTMSNYDARSWPG